MKFKTVNVALGLGFLIGLACTLGGLWIWAKPIVAQSMLEKSWTQTLKHNAPQRPWPRLDAHPIAKLKLARLNQSEIILNRSSGQALAFAPALIEGTTPLGEPGLSIISAHKNTHFSFLKHIKNGDIVELDMVDKTTLKYRITHGEIIHSDKASFPQLENSTLALMTCYPFDTVSFGGPLRYVVYAQKV